MSFNKITFKENLDSKNYSNCIYMLHEEIKHVFIYIIKNFDNNYIYTDLIDLKNKCLQFLDEEQKLLILEFYDLSFNQYEKMFELDRLLDIYKSLKR